jgi:hypothetical protein
MLLSAIASLFIGSLSAIVIASDASIEQLTYNREPKNIIIATSIGGSSVSIRAERKLE